MILFLALFGGLLGDLLVFGFGWADARAILLISMTKIWFVCTYYISCRVLKRHEDIV